MLQLHNSDTREEYVLLRSLKEEPQNFWIIWEKYTPVIRRMCYKLCGDKYDAEDLSSMSMVKAHEKLPLSAYKIKNLEAWLIRLVKNLFIDLYRAARSYQKICDTYLEYLKINRRYKDGLLYSHDVVNVVKIEIGKLSVALQGVATKFFLEGKKYREISEEMNLPESTLRKRVQLARKSLIPAIQAQFSGRVQ